MKGISLTSAMFVFQACYGSMQDHYDTMVTFHVVSEETGEPLSDVGISYQLVDMDDTAEIGIDLTAEYTDSDGYANVWATEGMKRYTFVDKDSAYVPFDTVINPADFDTIDIVLKKAK